MAAIILIFPFDAIVEHGQGLALGNLHRANRVSSWQIIYRPGVPLPLWRRRQGTAQANIVPPVIGIIIPPHGGAGDQGRHEPGATPRHPATP